MYCRDRNKNCIGRRVSGLSFCVWICIYLTWWRCTAIRGHNFKSNWASCLSLKHITWKIISLLSFMLAARCIKGRDAITQMDTKNRICVFGMGPFIGQILSVMLCASAVAGARAHTLSAINSDLWRSQSKRDQSDAFPRANFSIMLKTRPLFVIHYWFTFNSLSNSLELSCANIVGNEIPSRKTNYKLVGAEGKLYFWEERRAFTSR